MRKLPLVACYAHAGFSLFTDGLGPVYRFIMRFNFSWFTIVLSPFFKEEFGMNYPVQCQGLVCK